MRPGTEPDTRKARTLMRITRTSEVLTADVKSETLRRDLTSHVSDFKLIS